MNTDKKTREIVKEEALRTVLMPMIRCSGLDISMGVGKTLIALLYIDHFYQKSPMRVLVAGSRPIIQSWKNEMTKFNMEYLLECITFTTYISLPKRMEEYDIIILDEYHNLKYAHDEILKEHVKRGGRILGLSGTPPNHPRSESAQMATRYCPAVYEYLLDDAVEDNILNDYRIVIHKMNLNTIKDIVVKLRNGGTFRTSEQASYDNITRKYELAVEEEDRKAQQMASIFRMRHLMTFKSKEAYAAQLMLKIPATEKCIIFCNTQDQADRLCPHSFHTKNPDSKENLRKFVEGEITRLSCVLQLNEGQNIPHLKHGIILHSYGNNKKLAQRLGRLFRLSPDEVATGHVLCYEDTVDEQWIKDALEKFDSAKISVV